MKISFKKPWLSNGFTRTDAITLAATIIILGAVVWAGIWVAGEKRRIWVCAHHLKNLGQAFETYAHDHGGALPPAVLDDGTNSTSWDQEIAVYLEPRLAKAKSPDEQTALKAKIAYLFKCPSDREPHGGNPGRSYAMPMYDINRVGWPPTEKSLGGLGLYLDVATLKKARSTMESSDLTPAINVSTAPAPGDTALLVERISILNALWSPKLASVAGTKEQFDAKTFEAKDFHGGKLNYLMLDGHVELLRPAQSLGLIGGVWTIRNAD